MYGHHVRFFTISIILTKVEAHQLKISKGWYTMYLMHTIMCSVDYWTYLVQIRIGLVLLLRTSMVKIIFWIQQNITIYRGFYFFRLDPVSNFYFQTYFIFNSISFPIPFHFNHTSLVSKLRGMNSTANVSILDARTVAAVTVRLVIPDLDPHRVVSFMTSFFETRTTK